MTAITKKLILLLGLSAFFFFPTTAQDNSEALKTIESHRKEQHDDMLSDKSPLPAKEKKKFKGLNYYPINLDYHVKATFIKTENPVLFKMKTTKVNRNPDYSKYGEVHFTLAGTEYVLEVYQSQELMKQKGLENYLFIPFTDETNGDDTYEIGRYLDFRGPLESEIIVDFNLAYNPYCAYAPNYSCPIPPAANHLPIKIEAGEKKFKKKH